jgi:hypothetical protein
VLVQEFECPVDPLRTHIYQNTMGLSCCQTSHREDDNSFRVEFIKPTFLLHVSLVLIIIIVIINNPMGLHGLLQG